MVSCSAPVLSASVFLLAVFVDLYRNCVASGRVPKEFANLTNLANLDLYRNQLQVPGGAPTDSDGDMIYDSREKVAAFQACLEEINSR